MRILGYRLRRLLRLALIVVVVVLGLGSIGVYVKLFREEPAPRFTSDEDHFLFGSVGNEAQYGLPYWVWLVLPRVFPEYLPAPGGYAALGIVAKDGYEMPVGLSKVTIGYPRVGTNCAMCHTASVRSRRDQPQTLLPGAPAHQVAARQYFEFLVACASDPRFTADTLLAEIAKNYRLSLLDRVLYRLVVIPRTRRLLLRLNDDASWLRGHPDAGRGRADLVNAAKFGVLRQPTDGTIGNADMMPLWTSENRRSAYGWDGMNPDLQEVVLSFALAQGATPEWVDDDIARWNGTPTEDASSLRRIYDYIRALRPPEYPFQVDEPLAAAGAAVYARECASCHAPAAPPTGTAVDVGTDRSRAEAWTPAAAAAFNALGAGRSWRFSAFTATGAYVPVPLDGLWARAPYLHNGSVPTLTDLLEGVDRRPRRFWRGYDVYDPERVGFVTTGPDAERGGTLFDVAQPGNGNAGHLYGTMLPPGDKRALVEYLKTR